MYNCIYTRFNFVRAETAGGAESTVPTGSGGSGSLPPCVPLPGSFSLFILVLHPYTIKSACPSKMGGIIQKISPFRQK